MTDTDGKLMKQANVTIDQMCVIAAYERVMGLIQAEAGVLRMIQKADVAEKLDATFRHLTKHREDYIRSTQSGLIVAPAGAIQDIKGNAH